MRVDDSQRHILLVSWTGLLDRMSARVTDEQDAVADIRQLRGLADFAEEGRFRPIEDSDEELRPDSRYIRHLEQIIDDATECGIEEGWGSKKGLNRARRLYGYGRFLKLCSSKLSSGLISRPVHTAAYLDRLPDDETGGDSCCGSIPVERIDQPVVPIPRSRTERTQDAVRSSTQRSSERALMTASGTMLLISWTACRTDCQHGQEMCLYADADMRQLRGLAVLRLRMTDFVPYGTLMRNLARITAHGCDAGHRRRNRSGD